MSEHFRKKSYLSPVSVPDTRIIFGITLSEETLSKNNNPDFTSFSSGKEQRTMPVPVFESKYTSHNFCLAVPKDPNKDRKVSHKALLTSFLVKDLSLFS